MPDSSYQEVLRVIQSDKPIHIISHYNPDGDSVGSSLGLVSTLLEQGKTIEVFCSDPVPSKYRFLNDSELVSQNLPIKNIDDKILFVLDCSDLDRTGLSSEQISQYELIVNIDHHKTNEYYGDINLVVPEASATGEIIFELITMGNLPLNKFVAQALYVAISTDTGSFKFENTSSRTHEVIAELMKYEIHHSTMVQQIFDEKPLPYFFLLKNALSSLEFWCDSEISCMTLSNELLLQIGANMEMLDGVVNYAKNIDTVEIGLLFFVAANDEIKVGMRSKNVDISLIAEKFNGGGHARAAGFRAQGAYQDVKSRTIEAAIELLQKQK